MSMTRLTLVGLQFDWLAFFPGLARSLILCENFRPISCQVDYSLMGLNTQNELACHNESVESPEETFECSVNNPKRGFES